MSAICICVKMLIFFGAMDEWGVWRSLINHAESIAHH